MARTAQQLVYAGVLLSSHQSPSAGGEGCVEGNPLESGWRKAPVIQSTGICKRLLYAMSDHKKAVYLDYVITSLYENIVLEFHFVYSFLM